MQCLYKISICGILARYLYTISIKKISEQDRCSFHKVSVQDLYQRSSGKIAVQELYKSSVGKISIRGLLARCLNKLPIRSLLARSLYKLPIRSLLARCLCEISRLVRARAVEMHMDISLHKSHFVRNLQEIGRTRMIPPRLNTGP